MSRILFVIIFAGILFPWAGTWRRVVGMTLVAAITVGMVFPAPAYAQFGLIGGILNIINRGIRTVLNTIATVSRSLEALQQEIVWARSAYQPGEERCRVADCTVPRGDGLDLQGARGQRHTANSNSA
jgi:hypothetical protein